MRPSALSSAANKLTTWLTLWLMLAMLGQALLPTLAYVRSDTNPGLWDEICSVYGVRKNPAQQPNERMPAQHADCPLCLQAVHEAILDAPVVAVTFGLLLSQPLIHGVQLVHFSTTRLIVPAARGPPSV